jgi:hypothetical protein
MARELKTNTAVIVVVGPFLDKTDGVTLETGLTITNEKITLTAETDDGSAPTLILDNITGAASGTSNDLNYITDNDAGLMQIELSAANLNRLGRMRLTITDAANHVPVWEDFEVVSAQYYDAKYGTGNFSADAKAISGDTTAADNLEDLFEETTAVGNLIDMFDGTGYVGGTIKLASDATLNATQGSYAPAKAGDAMALVNDAITAAKFDESTAYPLKSADTGSTAVARTGADSDTLETLSDQIDGVNTAIGVGVPTNVASSANTETTGSLIGGTYANTDLDNGSYWITAPAAGGLDVYLTFALGAKKPNLVKINGNFNAAVARFVHVYAWDYVSGAWSQLSDTSTRMGHSTSDLNYQYILLGTHVSVSGEAKIRFASTSTTTGDRLNIDQCLIQAVEASATASQVAHAVYLEMKNTVYEGGVWIDTVSGTAGTDIGTHGTPWLPSLTYADALTIAAALGVKRLYLKPGSSITLTQDHTGWRFIGAGRIALGGQEIEDAVFEDCYSITGTGTGDDVIFRNCGIGTCTLDHYYAYDCMMKGTVTLTTNSAEREYFHHNCSDAVSSGTATFVMAATAELYLRNWRGGVQINGLAANEFAYVDGAGRIILNTDCSGGTVTVRGTFSITDNVVGGFAGTLTKSANITQITDKTDALPAVLV